MTLREDPGGASDSTLVPLGESLVAVHDATWEASLGIYLTFKGFKATPATVDESRDTEVDPGLAIAAP
jgi:hypothetical protein